MVHTQYSFESKNRNSRACEAQQAAQQTMHAKQKEALLLLRAAQNQTKPQGLGFRV